MKSSDISQEAGESISNSGVVNSRDRFVSQHSDYLTVTACHYLLLYYYTVLYSTLLPLLFTNIPLPALAHKQYLGLNKA